jgi:UDP-galactopyranose mutase
MRPDGEVLVVGAGFCGATVARVLADAGVPVRVLEKRAHPGGNAYDAPDAHGVLVHLHGPHAFHTNSPAVFDFLSRFTAWRAYEHRVLARVDGRLLPVPINRRTINALYGLSLDAAGVAAFLDRVRVDPGRAPANSEELVLASVGHDLCDRFFRGYTRKQWGMELAELSPGVAARIPTRCDDDDRYFGDRFQCMPAEGYTAMFRRMLAHPRITIEYGCDYLACRDRFAPRHLVYTGPIDAFFDHCEGRLPYRSLRFEFEHLPGEALVQPVAQVNYPGDEPWTRITEFRHMTGQRCSGTTLAREFPTAEGEPYYPIPTPAAQALHERYRRRADALAGQVSFVGRLAQYRYYNMDQAVAAALQLAGRLLRQWRPGR